MLKVLWYILRPADDSKIKRCDPMLYWNISLWATFICTSCCPLFAKKSFIFCSPSEYRLSLLSYVLCPVFLSLPLFPLPFFTSFTPAVFHLNISSSCLAASVACQVSSRSQGPTLKWSTGVIFRGVCEKERDWKRKPKGWDEKREAAWPGSEMSGGDKTWKGGEDMGVITNVLLVYFLFSPVNPSRCQPNPFFFSLRDITDVWCSVCVCVRVGVCVIPGWSDVWCKRVALRMNVNM